MLLNKYLLYHQNAEQLENVIKINKHQVWYVKPQSVITAVLIGVRTVYRRDSNKESLKTLKLNFGR